MKSAGICVLVIALGTLAFAQQQGTINQNDGTINNMDQTPDINQRLVGQTPPSGRGGHAGGNPDNTDRVNGRPYPVSGGNAGSAAASASSNSNGVDPNSSQPLNDKAAVAAAKKGISVPNNSPEANQGPNRAKPLTPSPGAEAASRPRTGSKETNEKPK